MKAVSIEFKKNGKQYIFYDNNLELSNGDYVIVETERGQQFGRVTNNNAQSAQQDHALVLKIAGERDIKQNEENISEASNSVSRAQELANDLGLDMKFIDAFYTFDKKQLVLHFLADSRIDFRELAKNLASIYKTRIELRQVGARDKAKEISGLGLCGRKICCSSFLNDLDSVGVSMVKNQNLALNPNKINGQCGRLLCCLKYEDDLYTDNRKKMPEIGKKVKDKEGFEGTVTFLDVPGERYIITNENGERKEQIVGEKCEECGRKNCCK